MPSGLSAFPQSGIGGNCVHKFTAIDRSSSRRSIRGDLRSALRIIHRLFVSDGVIVLRYYVSNRIAGDLIAFDDARVPGDTFYGAKTHF
jgi:hypothetical protein